MFVALHSSYADSLFHEAHNQPSAQPDNEFFWVLLQICRTIKKHCKSPELLSESDRVPIAASRRAPKLTLLKWPRYRARPLWDSAAATAFVAQTSIGGHEATCLLARWEGGESSPGTQTNVLREKTRSPDMAISAGWSCRLFEKDPRNVD
jgi:hypothetical protein